MALSIRLYITCCILLLSAYTNAVSPEKVSWNCMCFFLQVPSNVSIVWRIIGFISKFPSSSLAAFASRSFKVRMLLVSFVRRSVSKSTILMYLLTISGGIVPSEIASRYPFIEVRGNLKSSIYLIKIFVEIHPFHLALMPYNQEKQLTDLFHRCCADLFCIRIEISQLAISLDYMASKLNEMNKFQQKFLSNIYS